MKTVTDIDGVYASGIECGIKLGRRDLAFIYVPSACACAGTFTQNAFRAPCVNFTEEQIRKGKVKAIIANAGNANAATGKLGYNNAKRTAKKAAELLGIQSDEVAVASTGIIGVQLPIDKIEAGLDKLLANPFSKEGNIAARTIITTDLCAKEVFLQKEIEGNLISIAGIAKGSGMIAPNMATMLAFITTDAHIDSSELQNCLSNAVADSFNMTSVDTDTSTNDMCLALASGKQSIDMGKTSSKEAFSALLKQTCIELAKMIAKDGEGATKLIEVRVFGSVNNEEAKKFAKLVVDSPLVKTAIHGADPNWGRVVAALGKDPFLKINPEIIDLSFAGIKVLEHGEILDFNKQELVSSMKQDEIIIEVELNIGSSSAIAWGCDLTKGYIDINTAYN